MKENLPKKTDLDFLTKKVEFKTTHVCRLLYVILKQNPIFYEIILLVAWTAFLFFPSAWELSCAEWKNQYSAGNRYPTLLQKFILLNFIYLNMLLDWSLPVFIPSISPPQEQHSFLKNLGWKLHFQNFKMYIWSEWVWLEKVRNYKESVRFLNFQFSLQFHFPKRNKFRTWISSPNLRTIRHVLSISSSYCVFKTFICLINPNFNTT